jgi:hypothetical protein
MDLRRSRLASVTVGIPAVLWWVVGIGAAIAVLLVAMLDMETDVHGRSTDYNFRLSSLSTDLPPTHHPCLGGDRDALHALSLGTRWEERSSIRSFPQTFTRLAGLAPERRPSQARRRISWW